MSQELFKFSWTLGNVTAWDCDRRIESPCFVVKELGNAAFCLEWNGRGDIPSRCCLSLLRKRRVGTPEEVSLRYHVIVSNDVTAQVSDQNVIFGYEGGEAWYIEKISILRFDAWFLWSGEIQIQCIILKPESNLPICAWLLPMESALEGLHRCVGCSAQTRLKTRTVSAKWNIKHFSSLRVGEEQSTEIFLPSENSPRFLATLLLTDKVYELGTVEMNISNLREFQTNPTYVACKVTFGQDVYTRIVNIDTREFDSENSHTVWKLPIHIRKQRVVKEIRQDDVLPILLEFKVEEGFEFSKIEREACELDSGKKKKSTRNFPTNRKLSTAKKNLLAMLKDQKLCDVRLETATESIGAHTGILCASSPVFAGMFEHDTLEKAAKVIQVTVVSFETLERFLQCLYTEGLWGDLDMKEATELYFAADYYQVEFLKSECSLFLTNNLKVENVCDLLSMADCHQDKDLMNSVRVFMRKCKSQVYESEEWKKFYTERPKLAIETVQSLY